jgi:DNA-binding SARP family transcriptional activator
VDFRILGPVEARANGQSIALGGTKQHTMLAALLLGRGQLLPDYRLGEILWGERPPSTSSAQIYTYASRLRKCLGDDVEIIRRSPGYMMRDGDSRVDYDDFFRIAKLGTKNLRKNCFSDAAKQLREALSLWRGPALANTTEFLSVAEAPRLEEARTSALEDRIEADLALGQHLQLVSELRGLVAEYPLREKMRSQLMIALYRIGRQADALDVFREGRHFLAEELGVDPSAGLQKTYQAILEADPALMAPVERGPAITGVPRHRPAMLPPSVVDFTGRQEELSSLGEHLSARPDAGTWPRTTFLISGMAGVGKTSLALRAAHSQIPNFPGGQLYVDLCGAGPAPMGPADVLLVFLRALGADDAEIPADLDHRIQLYRGMIAGMRLLIVLDNASDDQQIWPLIPGNNESRVIVTSRRSMMLLDGVHLTNLEVFSPADGLAMLTTLVDRRRVAAEPEAAKTLVELCGFLPIAIRAVGIRLITKPHWSLSQLVERLSKRSRRSYLELTEWERDALCSLSRLESRSFSARTASEVLGLPYDQAEEIIESHVDARLLNAHLVDRAGWPVYQIHELVRLFACEIEGAEPPGRHPGDPRRTPVDALPGAPRGSAQPGPRPRP